ncbi:MAG: GNAT family N-acetyltransferase [Chloroflexota bacterium]
MLNLSSRLYAGEHDLQTLINLLLAVRPPQWVADPPGVVDLREILSLSETQADTRLWHTQDGKLVAFAIVDAYNNLIFELDPRAAGPEMEAEIVGWGETCIRRRMQASGEQITLDASCREDNPERLSFLERHGFERLSQCSLHYARPLGDVIPEPTLPPGFTIRPSGGVDEVEAWVALHRAAFGTDHMTVEERLAMLQAVEYELQTDLVVVAPDGRLAAYCMVQISQEENQRTGRNEGFTDPVACHPDYQKRGLGRALLLRGMHLLRERGIDTAVLATSSENAAMQALAASVGFEVTEARLWFAKPVA